MTRALRTVRHKIEKATFQDAEDFARVLTAAFTPAAVQHLAEPDTAKWYEHYLEALEEIWRNPKAHNLKAVDLTTGEVIGLAIWVALQGDEHRNLSSGRLIGAIPSHIELFSVRESSHTAGLSIRQDIARRLRNEFGSRQLRWIAGKPCQYLAAVAVIPSRQGQNIGEELVQVGMDEAYERQVACYLEATPTGYPVYKKLGWNEVDSAFDLDLREYAGADAGYGSFKFRSMLILPAMKR